MEDTLYIEALLNRLEEDDKEAEDEEEYDEPIDFNEDEDRPSFDECNN